MDIGIIGAGRIGQALAAHLGRAGHGVALANRRGPESLSDIVPPLGPHVIAATAADAAQRDLVVLAVRWTDLPAALSDFPTGPGRIVVDATNALVDDGGQLRPADLGGRTASEHVRDRLPASRLVKAFNTLYFAILAKAPQEAGGRRVIAHCGDDAAAKATVAEVIDSLGFAPLDVGGLMEGGRLMQAGGALSGANLVKLHT